MALRRYTPALRGVNPPDVSDRPVRGSCRRGVGLTYSRANRGRSRPGCPEEEPHVAHHHPLRAHPRDRRARRGPGGHCVRAGQRGRGERGLRAALRRQGHHGLDPAWRGGRLHRRGRGDRGTHGARHPEQLPVPREGVLQLRAGVRGQGGPGPELGRADPQPVDARIPRRQGARLPGRDRPHAPGLQRRDLRRGPTRLARQPRGQRGGEEGLQARPVEPVRDRGGRGPHAHVGERRPGGQPRGRNRPLGIHRLPGPLGEGGRSRGPLAQHLDQGAARGPDRAVSEHAHRRGAGRRVAASSGTGRRAGAGGAPGARSSRRRAGRWWTAC